MGIKLRDLKAEARRLIKAGQLAPALAVCDHLLASNPLDYETRLKIADLLAALGDAPGAAAVYRLVAEHDIRSGHPLPAIVALQALQDLGGSTTDLVNLMADLYAQGSPALAKFAARQAPVDLDAELEAPDARNPEDPEDPAAVVARARERAQDLSAFASYPEQFLPLAFFSELPRDVFVPVIRTLRVKRLSDGELIIREGEPSVSFFVVAAGQVRVFHTDPLGKRAEMAELHEGALFGEMALLAAQPRSASVDVVGDADILELGRSALASVEAEVPSLAPVLAKFARERLLKNLLATSPLFRPFTRQQQLDLIRRFDGHEVAPGTEIIREGDPGLGLYVVLAGEVEVTKQPAAPATGSPPAEVALARLRAGEIFGEMSLLRNQPTTASVRAVRQTTILFLAREYFQRLVEAVPEIRAYFETLSQKRDLDTRRTLANEGGGGRATDPDVRVMI
jgi:CRP-like cAMP-binding protein